MPNLFLFSFFPHTRQDRQGRSPSISWLTVGVDKDLVFVDIVDQFLEPFDWPCAFLLSAFG